MTDPIPDRLAHYRRIQANISDRAPADGEAERFDVFDIAAVSYIAGTAVRFCGSDLPRIITFVERVHRLAAELEAEGDYAAAARLRDALDGLAP